MNTQSPKIKNSIKSISNIDDFYLQLLQVIPKINNNDKYYFILIFDDGNEGFIQYKTDYLVDYNETNELSINLEDYLRKRKTINILGEFTHEYLITDYKFQDLLNYALEDKELFIHNKFTNVYTCKSSFMISKHNNYYNSILFTKYFKLREYIDEIYIEVQKIKRKYKKSN